MAVWDEEKTGRLQRVFNILVAGPIYRADLVGSGVASDVGLRGVAGNQHFHTGLDLGAEVDTAVHAIYGGTLVEYVEDANGIYGNHAILRHEYQGIVFYSLYAHLQGLAEDIQVDQHLDTGQNFALSGDTGNVAAHLHLSVLNEVGYATHAPVNNINAASFYDYYHRVPAYPSYDYTTWPGISIPYVTGPPFPRRR